MKNIMRLLSALLLTSSLCSCIQFREYAELPERTEFEITETEGVSTSPDTSIPTATETETTAVPETEIVFESTDVKAIMSDEALQWVMASPSPSEVIMTADEISAENARVLEESHELTDILAMPDSMSGDEVRGIVSERSRPKGKGPWFDRDSSQIPDEHVQSRIDSCGIEHIPETVELRRGVTVERGHLRSFPDDKPYYSSSGGKYDTLQHTELRVGVPLWILHTSTDGEYYFAVAYHYNGWIKAESVALTEDAALWREFAAPEKYVCVTDKTLTVGGVESDMGTVLPLIGKSSEGYTVKLPMRDADGDLRASESTVSPESASEGFLPYTYENFISQAFKYEGTEYGWGGLDGGVDCSGFISNVMGTFGFVLPRDTKHQESVVGKSVSMEGKTKEEIAEYMNSITSPAAVYYPGHVLFYLGRSSTDGKYYFIHAPQIGECVQVTSKESLGGVTYVCEFSA